MILRIHSWVAMILSVYWADYFILLFFTCILLCVCSVRFPVFAFSLLFVVIWASAWNKDWLIDWLICDSLGYSPTPFLLPHFCSGCESKIWILKGFSQSLNNLKFGLYRYFCEKTEKPRFSKTHFYSTWLLLADQAVLSNGPKPGPPNSPCVTLFFYLVK